MATSTHAVLTILQLPKDSDAYGEKEDTVCTECFVLLVHIFVRFRGVQTTAITIEENIKISCVLRMLRIQLNCLHQEI